MRTKPTWEYPRALRTEQGSKYFGTGVVREKRTVLPIGR